MRDIDCDCWAAATSYRHVSLGLGNLGSLRDVKCLSTGWTPSRRPSAALGGRHRE